MESYQKVEWSSEPLSIDKMQAMAQNDQIVVDEIDIRPRGIIGYSELTMYASNTENKGYRDTNISNPNYDNLAMSTAAGEIKNTELRLRDYVRVIDNWEINPNGLSVNVNVEGGRVIHLELYIPIFVHSNPSTSATSMTNWTIDGFVITRDGEQITAESGTDIWSSQPGSQSLHSVYYDCYDINPSPGPHLYEVMWKSQTSTVGSQLRMEIWEQNRTTVPTATSPSTPSATAEPDQQSYTTMYSSHAVVNSGRRYYLSEFTSIYNKTVKYTDASGYYTGEPDTSITTFAGARPSDFYYAGAIPTAQFIATDCGARRAMISFKENGVSAEGSKSANTTA